MKQLRTVRLSEACQIKPPKKEVKDRLAPSDLVSFVPMNCLGIDSQYVEPQDDKPLDEVYGAYTYFANNDVLLAKITPCFENGKLGIARNLTNGIGFGSSEYIVFRSNGELAPEYLYYFLLQKCFREAGAKVMTGAVGHKRVPNEFIENIRIPLPPLPEQKRIVAILDEAFAGISQAIANTERNLKNARELFESYLNDVFTRKGEGWFVTTISDLVEKRILAKPLDGNHGDVHPKKADFVQDGVPFIMASDLIDGDVDQIHCNHISRKQADALRKGFARDGDVLLTHKGTIGRSAVLSTQHDYVMLTPQVTYFRVIDSNIMSNRFLYFCFKSNIFQDEICEIAGKGSTRAYVGITRQLDLHVSYPPLDEQLLLVAAFDSLFSAAQRLEAIYQQKLTALAELKQSILQKAFTGRLTDNLPL